MNIPKSYEALSADLASEKILSKTLRGQKETYMMISDQCKVDLDEAMAREAALREELDALEEEFDTLEHTNITLKLSLAVAEQRENRLEELLREERRLHYGDETVQETKSRLFGHFGDGV